MGHMYEQGALTFDEMDEIKLTQPPTRLTRATVLLDMVLLGKTGMSMCKVLAAALVDAGYSKLVKTLEQTSVEVESGKACCLQ